MSRRLLRIDLETFSSIDIMKAGAYAYCGAPDFQILLIGFAFDDDPVRVLDPGRVEDDMMVWADLQLDLVDPDIIKCAWNANFERTCLSRELGIEMPPEQWRCSMVQAMTLGLPGSLAAAGKAIGLADEDSKMSAGKALINYFCKPCAPTARNGQRTRNQPHHDPAKWDLFKTYCAKDVEVERLISGSLRDLRTKTELQLWNLDQQINDRGIRVDMALVEQAIRLDSQYKERLETEAIQLTGLSNPNSVSALKKWLETAEGIEVESLNKQTVPDLIKGTDSDTVRRALEIRQEMAKTSVSKYQAMDRAVCPDRRVRGLLQFYGANRTGRWAGRLVQVQNLPQNKLDDLDLARQLVRDGDFETLELCFGSPLFVLSQLIRTAFIPADGHRFIVADFSAIEARVIAWLAGEQWRLDVFNSHGKIYEASASAMFHVPINTIGKGSPLRQKGKVAELALGYQGAAGALITMGALRMGLTEEELPGLVRAWRKANPKIVQLWADVEAAARETVTSGQPVGIGRGVKTYWNGGCLMIMLPSERRLVYQNARLDGDRLVYDGVSQERKTWGPIQTYGGKLVENIVQAIARDCLAESMLTLDAYGYRIVAHVHDEVIIEQPAGRGSLAEACAIMGLPPRWAPGLPLRADGYECQYYRKD